MNTVVLRAAGSRVLRGLTARRAIGMLILSAGATALAFESVRRWHALGPATAQALMYGAVAAAATALGTLPALFLSKIAGRTHAAFLGFGAGVMLAASAFSLVVPAIEAARTQGAGALAAALEVGAALLLGALLLQGLDRALPANAQAYAADGNAARRIRSAWLFVTAICLHNLPEGLAIGVAFGEPRQTGAMALATGIAIQDLPEGLVVALALRAAGYRRNLAVAIGALSGLTEPVMAGLGAGLIGMSAGALPCGLGLAAGAMLAVISREVIPDAHRQGHDSVATGGLIVGFILMMVLDTSMSSLN